MTVTGSSEPSGRMRRGFIWCWQLRIFKAERIPETAMGGRQEDIWRGSQQGFVSL